MILRYLDLLLQLKIQFYYKMILIFYLNGVLNSKRLLTSLTSKCKFMTECKISDVRHYTVNTSSGDFSIPVTDQEIDLWSSSNNVSLGYDKLN